MWYDYKLIEGSDYDRFIAAVNEALAQGYTPMGGVATSLEQDQFDRHRTHLYYLQAVALWYEPEAEPVYEPE